MESPRGNRGWGYAPLACLWMLVGAYAFTVRAETPPIRVTNYKPNTVIRYPVPLIRGELADFKATAITVTNTTAEGRIFPGLAFKGRFKVLCELTPGDNDLVLSAGAHVLKLRLKYVPQKNPYVVRVIYMTDKSGDTRYQSPLEDDPQDYIAKLGTAMKLMQTFTAERLNDLGYGRKTFRLELDENGRVRVRTFKGAKAKEEYYKLSGGTWWQQVAREVGAKFPTARGKNVVIAAYTRFDPKSGRTLGHTALGGSGLALFGSGNLFTWPSSIGTAQRAFIDVRRIDPKKFMSDSVGRHTFWGAASTTMGATLHELGHTFGLPHSNHPHDILTRGFDRFNRAFTFVDPVSDRSKKPVEFADTEVALFAPISAAALVKSPWLALDDPGARPAGKIEVGLTAQRESIVVRCENGVSYFGAGDQSLRKFFVAPDPGEPPRPTMTVPVASVRRHFEDESFLLVILDGNGRRRRVRFSDLGEIADEPSTIGTPPQRRAVVPTSERTGQLWRYVEKTPPAGWEKPDFDASKWRRGKAGFGRPGTPGAIVRTEWKAKEIWLRRAFNWPGGETEGLWVRIHHDEDAEVYLNGKRVLKLEGFTTGYTDRKLPQAAKLLRKGRNTLAVHCRQSRGGQYIDLGIIAEGISAR